MNSGGTRKPVILAAAACLKLDEQRRYGRRLPVTYCLSPIRRQMWYVNLYLLELALSVVRQPLQAGNSVTDMVILNIINQCMTVSVISKIEATTIKPLSRAEAVEVCRWFRQAERMNIWKTKARAVILNLVGDVKNETESSLATLCAPAGYGGAASD